MRAAVAGGTAVASAILVAACSSGPHGAGSGATTGTAPATSKGSGGAPTTAAPRLTPTVYNCGGGAYEPATLLIVCGVDTTMATGVEWATWTSSAASGKGNVAVTGHPPQPASLALRNVVTTSTGPQFSVLTVTWTGASPDGHPSDTFHLTTAGP